MFARSRFTEARSGSSSALGMGLPPVELWGVAMRDLGKPHRHRGKDARERRMAKRSWRLARRKGQSFKAWLKEES